MTLIRSHVLIAIKKITLLATTPKLKTSVGLSNFFAND